MQSFAIFKFAAPVVKFVGERVLRRHRKVSQLEKVVRTSAIEASDAAPAHAANFMSKTFIALDLIPLVRRMRKDPTAPFEAKTIDGLYRKRFGALIFPRKSGRG